MIYSIRVGKLGRVGDELPCAEEFGSSLWSELDSSIQVAVLQKKGVGGGDGGGLFRIVAPCCNV